MSERIRIRARARDGLTEVLVLMPHPMETGLRRDTGGAAAPAAHYITDVQVLLGERPVFEARLSIAVAQDPLISFRFRGGAPGERLSVAWTDNQGASRRDDAPIT